MALGVRVSDNLIPIPKELELAEGASLVVTGKPNPARRAMFQQLPFGAVYGHAPICCDSNDVKTQEIGVKLRMGRKMPTIDKQELNHFKQFVANWLRENLVPLDSIMLFEEWLEETMYPEHRKEELRRAYNESHGWPSKRDCVHIDSFQKTECYGEFKPPRGINSRSDKFKVFSGPVFKTIENQVYKLKEFVKHVPVADRPDLIRQMMANGARYFGTDYSRFESIDPSIMEVCEIALYDYMLSKFPKIAMLIRKTLLGSNHGVMKCGLRFKLKGRRMSGEMCTSLGNGFTNLMMFKYLMRNRSASVLVEGDDAIAAVYDLKPLPTAQDYAKLGFIIKIETFDDPTMASFCGIICPGGVTVKSPSRVLCKFGWTKNVGVGQKISLQLLRAKALSLAYELPHCPVLRAIADRALELTRGVKPRWDDFDSYHRTLLPKDETCIVTSNIPLSARQFYASEFGVTIESQLMIEARVKNSDNLDWVYQHIPANRDNAIYTSLFIQKT